MTKTKVLTRRYNKETYTFYLNKPDYIGERGVLGVEITPYITIETPDNGLGYTDTIIYNEETDAVYTCARYCPPWILRRIRNEAKKLVNVLIIGR